MTGRVMFRSTAVRSVGVIGRSGAARWAVAATARSGVGCASAACCGATRDGFAASRRALSVLRICGA